MVCATPPRGQLAADTHEVLKGQGFAVAPIRIGHRVAFVHAATAGLGVQEYQPKSTAAREIARLYEWTIHRAHQHDLLDGA